MAPAVNTMVLDDCDITLLAVIPLVTARVPGVLILPVKTTLPTPGKPESLIIIAVEVVLPPLMIPRSTVLSEATVSV